MDADVPQRPRLGRLSGGGEPIGPSELNDRAKDGIRMQAPRTVAVLGGNGVYARHLIPRLVGAGHAVRALVRRPEAAGVARACGAEVRVADIFDEASLHAALQGCAIGVNLATSLPGPSGRGDFQANDELRRNGTPIWVQACARAGVARIVQQSIAMVHAAGGDAWSDEDTPASGVEDEAAARAIAAARAMEEIVVASGAASGIECLILRRGLFYGPGTGLDDDWFARARAGKLRLPGDGSAYVSLVHIADMAEATVALAGGRRAHRLRRSPGPVARGLRVRRRGRRRRHPAARRPPRLSLVPRAQRAGPPGARLGAAVSRLSRRPRPLTPGCSCRRASARTTRSHLSAGLITASAFRRRWARPHRVTAAGALSPRRI